MSQVSYMPMHIPLEHLAWAPHVAILVASGPERADVFNHIVFPKETHYTQSAESVYTDYEHTYRIVRVIRDRESQLKAGDTVKVSARVKEGNRERIQIFEGTVMRLRGGGINRSITVRALRSGVGVERTFKVNSPRIEKIEVVRHGVARRAQLYFLRKRVGKAASLRERRPS